MSPGPAGGSQGGGGEQAERHLDEEDQQSGVGRQFKNLCPPIVQ